MKKLIFVLAIILFSGFLDAKPKKPKKIKAKNSISVGQTFIMVGCFMLGFSLTKEYMIEK